MVVHVIREGELLLLLLLLLILLFLLLLLLLLLLILLLLLLIDQSVEQTMYNISPYYYYRHHADCSEQRPGPATQATAAPDPALLAAVITASPTTPATTPAPAHLATVMLRNTVTRSTHVMVIPILKIHGKNLCSH